MPVDPSVVLGKLRGIVEESSACGLVSEPYDTLAKGSVMASAATAALLGLSWAQLLAFQTAVYRPPPHAGFPIPNLVFHELNPLARNRGCFCIDIAVLSFKDSTTRMLMQMYLHKSIISESSSCWYALSCGLSRTGGGVAADQVWEGGGAVLDGVAVLAAVTPQGKGERGGSCSKWDPPNALVSSPVRELGSHDHKKATYLDRNPM